MITKKGRDYQNMMTKTLTILVADINNFRRTGKQTLGITCTIQKKRNTLKNVFSNISYTY